MTNTHQMISRLFEHWRLDATQRTTLFAMIAEDESIAMVLLQTHAMLRLLYPEHPLRYEWVMRGNTRINGDRPIDVMLTGSEGIMRVNKVLRGQLIR